MKSFFSFWGRLLDLIANPFFTFYQNKILKQTMQEVVPPTVTAETSPVVHVPLITQFVAEIQAMEGWFPGSCSFTHNNPGNLRCTPELPSTWNVLATGQEGGFCTFKDEATGLQALTNNITSVCKGESPVYNQVARQFGLSSCAYLTLNQFFLIRDPASDGNQPVLLGQRFGKKLGVNPGSFTMLSLLG